MDDTFIASAQSPDQVDLILDLPTDKPVFVEGGFSTWLRDNRLHYFILRADVSEHFENFQKATDEYDDCKC